MSRSWNSLARGRVDESLRFHPLGPAALAVVAAAAILPADQLDHSALRSPKVVVPVAAVWMGVWLVRFLRAHVRATS
jgi:hypothetical protein